MHSAPEQYHKIGVTHRLSILAGQADNGESQEDNHRAGPADRVRDMCGERQLADASGMIIRGDPSAVRGQQGQRRAVCGLL
jgi:hypothetical protein